MRRRPVAHLVGYRDVPGLADDLLEAFAENRVIVADNRLDHCASSCGSGISRLSVVPLPFLPLIATWPPEGLRALADPHDPVGEAAVTCASSIPIPLSATRMRSLPPDLRRETRTREA